MGTVYVTQVPSRLEDGKWVPTVDLSPASEFGKVHVLLPAGMNFHAASPVMNQLRAELRAFDSKVDSLLPMGDPLIMAAAAAMLGRLLPSFRMLKWDRIRRRYYQYEVELG